MKELLLLLCRYPFEESNRETMAELLRSVRDWNKTVELINAHGIIALATYNIKEAGLEKLIPGDAMSVLENGYLKSIVRNTWLTERWKEVNKLLCEAGIKHILLKGMALEHTLYGSRGLRQMNDNDILVKREESVRAWDILKNEGYLPEPFKSPLFNKIKFDLGQHLPALYKKGYAIEIHDSFPGRRITNEMYDPFSDAIEITVSDTKAFILSKEMQLKYLINHFDHHVVSGDCQLRLYADIILLGKSHPPVIPDRFISDPMQSNKKEFRKAAYKARIRSINPKHRMRFLLGDTFPSMKWMQERYKCNWIKALFLYPLRIGKVRWLL